MRYIANGKFFESFEAVEKYASEMGLRVTSTEIIKGKHLCHLSK